MVVGLVTLAVDLVRLIVGDEATWRKYGALLEALVRDPLGTIASVLGAIVEPIVADWQAGRYGEAIGRAVFEVLPAILAFFTGGATVAGYAGKAGGIGRAADALGDAGRVISHIDDAGRIVDRIDDAGRIAGRIDDPAHVASRVMTRVRSPEGLMTPVHREHIAYRAARRPAPAMNASLCVKMAVSALCLSPARPDRQSSTSLLMIPGVPASICGITDQAAILSHSMSTRNLFGMYDPMLCARLKSVVTEGRQRSQIRPRPLLKRAGGLVYVMMSRQPMDCPKRGLSG